MYFIIVAFLPVSNASMADLTSVDTRNRLLSEGESRETRRANIGDTIDGGFASGFRTLLSSDDFLHVLSKEFATYFSYTKFWLGLTEKKRKNNKF